MGLWARDLLSDGTLNLPLPPDRPILVKTTSKEMEGWVDAELRELGSDGDGIAYRDRVEVIRETEEEGEAVFREMQAWRRRGMEVAEGSSMGSQS
jgi:hypothetical protein